MKKHLKIYLLLLLYIFSSCEKELYDDSIYQSKIKVEKFSLKDNTSKVKINSNLYKVVSKINKNKQNIAGKIVYDSINNIYFDDELGLKITKDDYESYTFKIIKEGGKLENLLLTKNENNEFDIFKVKYDYTEEEIKNLTKEQIENSPKIFTELTIDQSGQLQSVSRCLAFSIEWIIIASPRDDGDPNGPNAVLYPIITANNCGDGGTTGSGTTGSGTTGSGTTGSGTTGSGGIGGGSGGGGGSSTNNSPSAIITTPVHGVQQVNHVEKLKKLLKVQEAGESPNIIRDKIKAFKTQLKTETLENGVEYRRTGFVNNQPVYIPIYPIDRTPTSTEFGPPAINTAVYIHFHPDIIFGQINGENILACPIPSIDDFSEFANKFNLMGTNSNRNNLTSIVVTRSGLFAMRVEDPNKVLAFNQYMSIGDNKVKFKNDYQLKVVKKAFDEATIKVNAQPGLTSQQAEAILNQEFTKWLAQFILEFNNNTIDTGILLFFGDIEGAETTWNQLQTTKEP